MNRWQLQCCTTGPVLCPRREGDRSYIPEGLLLPPGGRGLVTRQCGAPLASGKRLSRERGSRGLQVPLEEREDFPPGVNRLLRAIARAVDREETVTRAVVAMELVVLVQPPQLGLDPIDLLDIGIGVIIAGDPEQ